MTAATIVRRTCEAPDCDELLRDPRARTCSPACRTALHRVNRGHRPRRQPCVCERCNAGFTARRNDARFCPKCRVKQPKPQPAAHEVCEWLHGPTLASWLEDQVRQLHSRLNGQTRTFERWKEGGRANFYETVDPILQRLNLAAWEVPEEAWIKNGGRR